MGKIGKPHIQTEKGEFINEKKNKLNSKIDNIIKEKQENKTLDEIAEEKFKQKEFIENNIKNAELD